MPWTFEVTDATNANFKVTDGSTRKARRAGTAVATTAATAINALTAAYASGSSGLRPNR